MNTFLFSACLVCGCICGYSGALYLLKAHQDKRAKALLKQAAGAQKTSSTHFSTHGATLYIIDKLVSSSAAIEPTAHHLPRSLRSILSMGTQDLHHLLEQTGTAGLITLDGFMSARFNLTLLCSALGTLIGIVFSTELALGLGCIGAVVGFTAPKRALIAERNARSKTVDHQLCDMLEVIILGLQSGLSFNKALSLYSTHFSGSLAREAEMAEVQWSHGLLTREEGLRTIAAHYNSPQLTRSLEAIIRALRFGTSMTQTLSACAEETRQIRKANLEEAVAKAPIKMLIPVGTLMLPAMLILVLGPILLELMNGI